MDSVSNKCEAVICFWTRFLFEFCNSDIVVTVQDHHGILSPKLLSACKCFSKQVDVHLRSNLHAKESLDLSSTLADKNITTLNLASHGISSVQVNRLKLPCFPHLSHLSFVKQIFVGGQSCLPIHCRIRRSATKCHSPKL